MLKLLRKQKPKVIITACVCLPLLVIPESQGTPPESVGGVEMTSPSPSEEGERCKDLGLYQPIYVEFAEVLSQYNPEQELEEVIDYATSEVPHDEITVQQNYIDAVNDMLELGVINSDQQIKMMKIAEKW